MTRNRSLTFAFSQGRVRRNRTVYRAQIRTAWRTRKHVSLKYNYLSLEKRGPSDPWSEWQSPPGNAVSLTRGEHSFVETFSRYSIAMREEGSGAFSDGMLLSVGGDRPVW
jgi:hypothetical protein